MSWQTPDSRKKPDREKDTVTQRFFTACLLVLGGVLALTLALDFLSRIWGWLLLVGIIAAALWMLYRAWQARRDRW